MDEKPDGSLNINTFSINRIMNLILIGFRCTGKSSVGKAVAKQLGRRFVDIDDYIEAKEGRTIKEIFDKEGEIGFRRLEREAIEELCKMDNMVIATGGGAVMDEENIRNMKRNGYLILLEAWPEVIYSRLMNDAKSYNQRPNLTQKSPFEEIKHLLETRKPFYHNNADLVLDSSKESINSISKKIISIFNPE